jgi:hypothetical protein
LLALGASIPIENNPPVLCAETAVDVTSNRIGNPADDDDTLQMASFVVLNDGALSHVIPVPVHELLDTRYAASPSVPITVIGTR